MAYDLILGNRPRTFSREDSTGDVCGNDISDDIKSSSSSLLIAYKVAPKPVKIAVIAGGVFIAYGVFSWLAKNINARV